ncbi:MAG: peptide chain release factor 1 [Legionellales bacterium]|nr:MAG: peptide chain release factor 1 [Legionellales bacterium]
MKQSFLDKLTVINSRYTEIETLLQDPDTLSQQDKLIKLSKEQSQLEPIIEAFNEYQSTKAALDETLEMQEDSDPEIKQLAAEELPALRAKIQDYEKQLQTLLIPKDPSDTANVFLEIRAGTGGDEAAIFVGDLFRMYGKYAEIRHWKFEITSANESDKGGYKLIIAKVSGKEVYGTLKFESGAHRVQRVPATETQGRVHTSACTIAVMPEAEEIAAIEINPSDLRIDTFRASGAGGQHVNKTDSAIRLTHMPSGLVVECQDDRSQHKNKAKAMTLLKSKLLMEKRDKQNRENAATRKSLVGSGDRSEKIRTYNFPQNRLTDHRINLTSYNLDRIMEGDLDPIIKPLMAEHQVNLLAEFGE